MTSNIDDIRFDLKIIASWITPQAKVIDLGCGEGDLLHYLIHHKKVNGRGIEKAEAKVARCIEKGLSVLQGDINLEVLDYPDNAFDYVILSQTLQQVYQPDRLLAGLLRIGKQVVVSFPNFGYIACRAQLLLTGLAPKTRELPFEWYDTPNIRVISLQDFINFARRVGFRIYRQAAVNTQLRQGGDIVRLLPNLLATNGIFLIGKTG